MTMYTIRVKEHLDQSWSAWFDGMTITNRTLLHTIPPDRKKESR